MGEVAGRTKKDIELQSGEKVISQKNYLNEIKNNNLLE